MNKIALVGQAPSRTSDPTKPFSGKSGQRIARLAHRPLEEWADCFNLVDHYPGPRLGKGDSFEILSARESANKLKNEIAPYPTVVLVGRLVARSFGLAGDYPWFVWTFGRIRIGHRICAIPHPSGVSTWWNDPNNEEHARRFLRGLANGRI